MNGRQGVMVERGHRGDYVLGLAVCVLLAFGLVMMYNINPAMSQKAGADTNYFRNQLMYIAVGIGAWAVTSGVYYQRWRRFAVPLLVISVLAVIAVLIPGIGYSALGAARWIHLGPFSFQPSELLKLALVIYLATWFEQHREDVTSLADGVVPFVVMVGVAGIFIAMFQRDLGTMIVVALSTLGMFYLAGIRIKHLLGLVVAGIAAGWLAILAFPHRMSRFLIFLDPSKDATGQGYHINQALIGIGSGGLVGVGLGKSIQIYGYLPEAPNDSIFAVISEEFGFIGAVILLVLFGILVVRGFEIAHRAPNQFARLTAAGITMVIMFQAFINIAAMLSLVPLTGIPLPFVSYGGSSLVIMMGAIGLLFNISKYTVKEGVYADSRQRRGDGRPRLAGTGNRRRVAGAR